MNEAEHNIDRFCLTWYWPILDSMVLAHSGYYMFGAEVISSKLARERRTHMPDVELDITNEAHEATEIAAQDDFSESYVFQADATTGPASANIDGLRGRGLNAGIGVLGQAPFAAVVGEGGTFGCVGRGPAGGPPALVGVRGIGELGVDARGTLTGVNARGTLTGVNARGGEVGAIARATNPASVGVEAEGEGAGVVGRSSTGEGVHGGSAEGRGGVFQSGRIAQLRLVPSPDNTVPLHGRIGDLYVHLGREGATMYLCINDNPVQWRQVQLGPAIAGGDVAP
jgi:hypothetical protein